MGRGYRSCWSILFSTLVICVGLAKCFVVIGTVKPTQERGHGTSTAYAIQSAKYQNVILNKEGVAAAI
jgi:hypothetical protein